MRAQAAKIDVIIIARAPQANNSAIIGALRLCPVKGGWLLRSMSIRQDYQRQGIGSLMLGQIKAQLAEKTCYCFAYRHLQSFYQKAGFKPGDETAVSEEISQRYRQYRQKGKDIVLMQSISD